MPILIRAFTGIHRRRYLRLQHAVEDDALWPVLREELVRIASALTDA